MRRCHFASGVQHARRITRRLDVCKRRARLRAPHVREQWGAQTPVPVFACQRTAQAMREFARIQQRPAHAVTPAFAIHVNQRVYVNVRVAGVPKNDTSEFCTL